MLKTRKQAFSEMPERFSNDLDELKKSENDLLDALVYELKNHEYCITYDITPALFVLGLTENDIDPKILNKARKLAS
jgi:hypothetical protein